MIEIELHGISRGVVPAELSRVGAFTSMDGSHGPRQGAVQGRGSRAATSSATGSARGSQDPSGKGQEADTGGWWTLIPVATRNDVDGCPRSSAIPVERSSEVTPAGEVWPTLASVYMRRVNDRVR